MKVKLPLFGNQYDGVKMREMTRNLDLAFRSINTAVTQLQRYSAIVDMSSPTLFQKMNGLAGITIGSAGIAGTDAAGAYTFFIDPTTGAASFAGTVTASAGAIGGFDIGADYVRDTANSFGLASTVTGGDDVRFWAGATFANRATAPARLTEAGAATFTNISITGGNISTTGYVKATGTTTTSGAYPEAAILGVPTTSGRAGGYFEGNAHNGAVGLATTSGHAGFDGGSTHASGYGVYASNTGGGVALKAGAGSVQFDSLALTNNAVVLASSTGTLTVDSGITYNSTTDTLYPGHIAPAIDSTYDIGTGSLYFEDVYIEYPRTLSVGCLELSGLSAIASTAVATIQALSADTGTQADFYPGNSGSATAAGIDWPCWAWTLNGMIVKLLDAVGDEWDQSTWN